MSHQATLWDAAPPANAKRRPSIAEQYEAFIQANDWVVDEVIDRARALRRAGVTRYGVKAIIEAMRYDRALQFGDDGSTFRVNNSVAPLLARHVMDVAPDLRGLFEVRALRAA